MFVSCIDLILFQPVVCQCVLCKSTVLCVTHLRGGEQLKRKERHIICSVYCLFRGIIIHVDSPINQVLRLLVAHTKRHYCRRGLWDVPQRPTFYCCELNVPDFEGISAQCRLSTLTLEICPSMEQLMD